MQLFPLIYEGLIPEIYSLGFTGTHFQFFVSPDTYELIVKDDRLDNCRHITYDHTTEGTIALSIPATPPIEGDTDLWKEMREYAHTISTLTNFLWCVIAEKEQSENSTAATQLFHVGTYLGPAGEFHAAGLDLSVSPAARAYLQQLGEHLSFEDAVHSMCQHHAAVFPSREHDCSSTGFWSYRAALREKGLLDFRTLGDCACLGASPDSIRGIEGYYLSSHNVDNVVQQFSLLVGIAAVWQKVRTGLMK